MDQIHEKHFFILGRNTKLSRQEIFAYLRARNRHHEEIFFEENLLVIETKKDEKFDIQEFGGILQLGKITFEGNEENLEEFLKDELIPGDKFSYATFGNIDPQFLKEIFKKRKKKATLKHGRKQIKFQDGEKQEFPKAQYNIFIHEHKSKIYLGISNQVYNSARIKERDMKKPVRREHLAISPRLAKILINLSEAKPHDLLLDPFCGVAGILQEALLKKINVYGIDKDPEAIKGAQKNLEWLKSKYPLITKYQIVNQDSKKAPDFQFKAIATETPLGKVFRKKPSDNEAKKVIQNFESFIIPILIRLKKVKKPNAKIAITFPVVNKFHVNIEKISKKTKLEITLKPILESRKDQFISRDILVLK